MTSLITLEILISSNLCAMNNTKTVFDCDLIYLPKIFNRSGNITPIHNNNEIPFSIKRIFYLYDIPSGENRGAHAHKDCHQFLLAVSGSFEVLLDDGRIKRLIQLNRPHIGIHIPPGVWASELNFSAGSVCLVLASHIYDEQDYIRNYNDYLIYKKL